MRSFIKNSGVSLWKTLTGCNMYASNGQLDNDCCQSVKFEILLLCLTKLLYVSSLDHFLTVGDRWFLKSLASAELFYDTCSLEFTFEFFESFLDVLVLFYLYDNHLFFFFYFYWFNNIPMCTMPPGQKSQDNGSAKLIKLISITKFYKKFFYHSLISFITSSTSWSVITGEIGRESSSRCMRSVTGNERCEYSL